MTMEFLRDYYNFLFFPVAGALLIMMIRRWREGRAARRNLVDSWVKVGAILQKDERGYQLYLSGQYLDLEDSEGERIILEKGLDRASLA